MNSRSFQAGGPLRSDSPVYLRREADSSASACLMQMQYITLIEGRQQGKTSLINNLIGEFSPLEYCFAMIDLTDLSANKNSVGAWYTSLGQLILEQLPFTASRRRPKAPDGNDSWKDFLTQLSKIAVDKKKKVVIVLDEIGAMPPGWSTDFFTIIRSIYINRQSQPFHQHISFIIAGAFDPKSLIDDPSVSGFNIDFQIPLDDFDQPQVRLLAGHLDAASDVIEAAAKRVFYWTDGQPFLSQWLFFYLANRASPLTLSDVNQVVDAGVERFLKEDRRHLGRIKELMGSPELLDCVRRLDSERFPFTSLIDDYFRLANVLGIIKADSERFCKIRNRIYERALAELNILRPTKSAKLSRSGFKYDAFISYSSKDIEWVREKLLPPLEQKGLRVCIDRMNFQIGTPSLVNMEEAIKQSRKILLILTPNWVESEWGPFESMLIQVSDPDGRARRLLPVLAAECVLPDRLRILTHLDLTEQNRFDSQMKRLIDEISSD